MYHVLAYFTFMNSIIHAWKKVDSVGGQEAEAAV